MRDERCRVMARATEGNLLTAAALLGLGALGFIACGVTPEPVSHDATAVGEPELDEIGEALLPSAKVVGTWCQGFEYQTTSAMTPPGPGLTPPSCTQASSFSSNFKNVTTSFTINHLVSPAKANLEASLDHLTNELVDLAFFEGHSGYSWVDTVDFGMWEDGITDPNKRAFSKNMAFGHTSANQRGLSVFAAYSCDTVDFNGIPANGANGSWAADWWPAFNPGLRMMLGSNNVTHFVSSGVVGKKFAERLTAGDTFKTAWTSALDQVSHNPSAAFVASGSTSADCWDRMNTMSWGNFDSKPRRVNPAWLCVSSQTL